MTGFTAGQEIERLTLEKLIDNKTPSTVFLVNGVKLQGVIIAFDKGTVALKREAHTQLIYRHAISTVMPNEPFEIDFDYKPGK